MLRTFQRINMSYRKWLFFDAPFAANYDDDDNDVTGSDNDDNDYHDDDDNDVNDDNDNENNDNGYHDDDPHNGRNDKLHFFVKCLFFSENSFFDDFSDLCRGKANNLLFNLQH